MSNRCPPAHVRRLVGLNCPISEIIRITGYTEDEIAEMVGQGEWPPFRKEQRRKEKEQGNERG